MYSKTKRVSIKSLSVLMAVIMLISALFVGTINNASASSTDKAATADSGTITIYFNNRNMNWTNIYVNFYDRNCFDSNKGVGSQTSSGWQGYGQMTQIGTTNWYYYTYTGTYSSYVAFANFYQNNYEFFWDGGELVWVTNFSTSAPYITPETGSSGSKNKNTYYYTYYSTIVSGGYIYFDNSTVQWDNTYIYFVIGKSSYSSVYQMTRVTNTDLYYVKANETWKDATYYAFIGSNSAWNSDSWGSSNLANASNATAAQTSALLTVNKTYIVTPSSTKNAAFTISEKDTYAGLNTQTNTVQAQVKTIGSSSYSNASAAPGGISFTTYAMSGDGAAATTKSGSITSGGATTSKSTTNNAVGTNTVLTRNSTATGYSFAGWYDATKSASLGTTSPKTANVGSSSFYARFNETAYTVTVNNNGDTGGTDSTGKVGVLTSKTVTATAKAGYTSSWTLTSGTIKVGGVSYSAGSTFDSTSVTFNATNAVTFTAVYTEIMHDVTVTDNTYTSDVRSDVVGIDTTYTVTAANKTDYTFSGWTVSPSNKIDYVTGDASAQTIVFNATDDITLTANYVETKYDVNIYASHGTLTSISNPVQIGNVTQYTITAAPDNKYWYEQAGGYSADTGITVDVEPADMAEGSMTFKIRTNAAGDFTINFVPKPIEYEGVTAGVQFSPSYAHANPSAIATSSMAYTIAGDKVSSRFGAVVSYSLTDTVGYSFDHWESTGGTFVTAGGSSSTTTASPTFFPIEDDAVAYAVFTENMHTVTVNEGQHGSASANNVNVGKYTSESVTFTADLGWVIDSFTTTGNVTITDTSGNAITSGAAISGNNKSYTIIINATGDGATVTVAQSKRTHNITYTINGAAVDSSILTLSNQTTSAQYANSVTFTVTPSSEDYRITGISYTDGNLQSGSVAVLNSGLYGYTNTYSFSLPPSDVTTGFTVNFTTINRYQINFSKYSDTLSTNGITSISSSISSGAYVDSGSTIVITAILAAGYEINETNTSAGDFSRTSYPADTGTARTVTYTLSSVTSSQSFVLAASKILYWVTPNKNVNAGGTLTLNGSEVAIQLTIGDSVTAAVTAANAAGYDFDHFEIASANYTDNPKTVSMSASDLAVYAVFKAMTPTFTANNVLWYAGEEYTYPEPTVVASSTTTFTYTLYDFDDTSVIASNSTGTFTTPDIKGAYRLHILATNAPAGVNSVTYERNITVTVKAPEFPVNYYIDMHGQSGAPTVTVVSHDYSTTLLDDEDNACIATLTPDTNVLNAESKSTVYSALLETPCIGDSAYIKITYGGQNYNFRLNRNSLTLDENDALKGTYSVWFEARGRGETTFVRTPENDPITSIDTVEEGYKRIYVRKPASWIEDHVNWTKIGVYYYGGSTSCIWGEDEPVMDYMGYDDNYYYYRADIPNGATHVIFQGQGTETKTLTKYEQTSGVDFHGNYWTLSYSGGAYSASEYSAGHTAATIDAYSSAITMNLKASDGVSAMTASILPASSNYTGTPVYTITNGDSITINNGVATAVAQGATTVNVKIYGTIGSRIASALAGYLNTYHKDYIEFNVTVNVFDPEEIQSFQLMSYNTYESTFEINQIDDKYPGKITAFSTSLLRNYGGARYTYANAGIITAVIVDGLYEKYTVKYADTAEAVSDNGYTALTLTADIATTEVEYDNTGLEDSLRYGFKQWTESGTPNPSYKDKSAKITVTGNPFVAVYESYKYVDATITYYYYDYNTERDGKQKYQYDKDGTYDPDDWFDNDSHTTNPKGLMDEESDNYDEDFAATHTLHNYTVECECRFNEAGTAGWTGSTVDYRTDLRAVTLTDGSNATAIDVAEDNLVNISSNYYDYAMFAASTAVTSAANADNDYEAAISVYLVNIPRTYTVCVNGSDPIETSDTGDPIYYQNVVTLAAGSGPLDEYASNTTLEWYEKDSDGSNPKLMMTGASYKIFVSGNTYITATPGSTSMQGKSAISYKNHAITKEGNDQEKLTQFFYLADYFNPNMYKLADPVLLATSAPDPYFIADAIKFVGGGVVFYSVDTDGNVRMPNLISDGYLTAENVANITSETEAGTGNYVQSGKLIDLIRNKIQGSASDAEDLALAYATEIEPTTDKDPDTGANTGIVYRYLPYESVNKDSNGDYILDDKGEYTYTRNENEFRYSTAISAFQYNYGHKAANKVSNDGKIMRVYSFFVFSYIDYTENNDGETKYVITFSENYADAATYVPA